MSVCLELRRVNNMINRKVIGSQNIKYVDELTGATSWIIGYLVHHSDEDVFQRDIEKEFSLRRSTVSKCLTFMERKGLLVRESVNHDARLKKLVLTERAMELNELIAKDMRKIEAEITAGLTEDDLTAFFAVIKKIKYNLSKDNGH